MKYLNIQIFDYLYLCHIKAPTKRSHFKLKTPISRENCWKKFLPVEDSTPCLTSMTGEILSKKMWFDNHSLIIVWPRMQFRKRQKSDVDKSEKRRQRSERGKSSNIEVRRNIEEISQILREKVKYSKANHFYYILMKILSWGAKRIKKKRSIIVFCYCLERRYLLILKYYPDDCCQC